MINNNFKIINGISVYSENLNNADPDQLRQTIDEVKNKMESGVIIIGSSSGGKALLLLYISDDLTYLYNADNLIKQVTHIINGGGGGSVSLAQAGGTNPHGINGAINMLETLI